MSPSIQPNAWATLFQRQLQRLSAPAPGQRTSPQARLGSPNTSANDTLSPSRENGAFPDPSVTLLKKVRALDPLDPDRPRKAFRAFLEALLIHEWGRTMINDPGFYRVVDAVHAEMEQNPELLPMMKIAGDELIRQADIR